ncbi:sugar transferase [Algoriphagus zhangzhouensis]|uniref:sugar transferase n=1 Tax=Algoriphagus zhangzhouensis TaxID=1073327 RepID=UPI002938FA19|nr:sugar transferase [Algoriphagus zhangzhouensis]
MDLFLSSLLFLLLLPIFFILFLILSIHFRGNPIFTQPRPGLNSQIFQILKFKTMKDTLSAKGDLLPDSERITDLGRLVRKFSLDEIPQLLNVIKGDMSLVGPRPLLVEYLPLYSKEQIKRHDVRPGVTGWAQINGRNAISWEEKFQLDVYYVDHISIILDLKILFITFFNVIQGKGVSQQGHVSMGKFEGN